MQDNFEIFDEIFNSDTLERQIKHKHLEIRETEPIQTKFKGVKAHRRKYDATSKWSTDEEKKYLKFILSELNTKPHVVFSWKLWKPEGIFPRMADYIGSKDARQCKSYDQRKKQNFYCNQGIDIIEYAEKQIKKFQKSDNEVTQLLDELCQRKTQKSEHMDYLQNKVKNLRLVDAKLQQFMYWDN